MMTLPDPADLPAAMHLSRQLRMSRIEGEGGVLTRLYADKNITASLYMMIDPEFSALHALDAAEVFTWQGGSPARMLELDPVTKTARTIILGSDIEQGHQLQYTVPRGRWQGTRPLGPWTLVGLTVAPAFRFDGFRLGDRERLIELWPEWRTEILAYTRTTP